MDKETEQEVEKVISDIEKKFGSGSASRLNSKPVPDVTRVSTDLVSLDYILGGGMPKNRIVEIFGQPSIGKTTLTLQIAAEYQKLGEMVAYIDVENCIEPDYLNALGIDENLFLLCQLDSGDAALECVDMLIRSGSVGLVCVDSVAALVPAAEIAGEVGEIPVGLQARLMSSALRKITTVIGKSNATLIFLNQTRQKIGIAYGNPNVTSGGVSLHFYSSIRISMDKAAGSTIKEGDETIGIVSKLTTVKNKLAPPYKKAELSLYFGTGFCKYMDTFELAVARNIIEKAGTWFSYSGERLGQGRNNVKQYMIDNPDIYSKIKAQVREAYGV